MAAVLPGLTCRSFQRAAEVLAFAQSGSFLCQFLEEEYATPSWPCSGLPESVVEARGVECHRPTWVRPGHPCVHSCTQDWDAAFRHTVSWEVCSGAPDAWAVSSRLPHPALGYSSLGPSTSQTGVWIICYHFCNTYHKHSGSTHLF